MAQVYESGNIILKIESLSKKIHSFIDVEDNTNQASMIISRSDKGIILSLDTKRNINENNILKNVIICYNKFIDKNKKYNNYSLSFHNLDENSLKIYAIKKDFHSPIKLITKEQIDQLDRCDVSYYNYSNNIGGLKNINENNIKCFINNNSSISLDDDNCIAEKKFFIDDSQCVKGTFVDTPLANIFIDFINCSDNNKEKYLKLPSVEIANANSEKRRTINITNAVNIHDKGKIYKRPLDLSKIDNSKYNDIILSIIFDRESLAKTLTTIKNSNNIQLSKNLVDSIGIKTEPVESTRFLKKYNIVELLEEIRPQQNELINECH